MALEEFKYRLPITVVFGDIDYYRHVNNVVYIRWMETARIDYCKVAFDRPLGAPINVILAAQSFTYERQAQYDDRLVMGVRTSRIGNKSIEFAYELWRNDERIGHGTSTQVAFDYAANRSVRVPDEWRRRVAAFDAIAVDGLSP